MKNDLHALAYFSRNAIRAEGGELEAEVANILAKARDNNRRMGVTGALLFSQGCFAQVLEGDLAQVEQVFERIGCDARHSDVTILHFNPIEERSFGNWSMAFAGTQASAAPLAINGLLDDPERIKSGDAGRDLVGVLKNLIGRYDGNQAAGFRPDHRPSLADSR